MQLYAHWLDGEFVRLATQATGPKQNTEDMTRALKLHALLGTKLVLSDIQVFDSAAILNVFADRAFLDFLTENEDFLDLRVESDSNLGAKPFELAARGLVRTQNDGWISSVFLEDPIPIKQFAADVLHEIANKGYVDSNSLGAAELANPAHKRQFRAMREAINYFGRHEKAKLFVAPPGDRISYFDVLKQTRLALIELANNSDVQADHSKQAREDLANIEDTMIFIECAIEDPADRKRRSLVMSSLHREPDPIKKATIWNNVVQAWNYATEQTIQPGGSSVGNLPGAVSMAPYLQKSTDVLVPLDVKTPIRLAVKADHLPMLPIDIDKIAWAEIGKARSGTAKTRNRLSYLRSQNDTEGLALVDGLREHLDAMSKVLYPSKGFAQISGTPYAFCIGKAGFPAAVAAVIGVGTTASLAIAATGFIVDVAKEAYSELGTRRQRKALTGTLFNPMVGQVKGNLHKSDNGSLAR